jgi:putative flippase GtrA
VLARLSASLPQPVRFAVTGVLNTLLDVGIFGLLTWLTSIPAPVANVISYSCGLCNSFVVNQRWTFSVVPDGSSWRQFGRFLAVNLISLCVSTAMVWQLASSLGVMPAKLAAVLATYVLGFYLNKKLVFRCA